MDKVERISWGIQGIALRYFLHNSRSYGIVIDNHEEILLIEKKSFLDSFSKNRRSTTLLVL